MTLDLASRIIMIINDALPHLDLDTCKTKSAEKLSECFLAVFKHFCVFGRKKKKRLRQRLESRTGNGEGGGGLLMILFKLFTTLLFSQIDS